MYLLLCTLWPYLVGILIGWLLGGLLARRLKYLEPAVETIIEKKIYIDKVVDNPEHLSLIQDLKTENEQIQQLQSRIDELNNRGPEIVEKKIEVEKLLDNPIHLARIRSLEIENAQVQGLRNRILELENKSKLENKKSFIPDTYTQLGDSEVDIDMNAAKVAGLKLRKENDFTVIEGIGSKINTLLHADDINSFRKLANTDVSTLQKMLADAGPNFKMADPSNWPEQALLASTNRWSALKSLQDLPDEGIYPEGYSKHSHDSTNSNHSSEYDDKIRTLEEQLAIPEEESGASLGRASGVGFMLRQQNEKDDFTVIEGIGSKVNELIHADGVNTFEQLSKSTITHLQKILDKAGPNFRLANPSTWPVQAKLAANNDWEALKRMQDELNGDIK